MNPAVVLFAFIAKSHVAAITATRLSRLSHDKAILQTAVLPQFTGIHHIAKVAHDLDVLETSIVDFRLNDTNICEAVAGTGNPDLSGVGVSEAFLPKTLIAPDYCVLTPSTCLHPLGRGIILFTICMCCNRFFHHYVSTTIPSLSNELQTSTEYASHDIIAFSIFSSTAC